MSINNDNQQEIDLCKVDWNNLSPKEYNQLESILQEKQKLLKATKRKDKLRSSGNINVSISGKVYSIKEVTFKRLKSMKSDKSKEKLIQEIISTHNPIEKL